MNGGYFMAIILKEYRGHIRNWAELCEELGVTYVDNTTLVLGHPELWDTDGIHPVQDVYLWMLSHMCYEAGI